MSDIREPLITTTLTELKAQTIASSVGRVYLSKPMIANQEDAVRIIDAWRSVHVPTAGALIPNTCKSASVIGAPVPTALFSPTVNKSYSLYAADISAEGGTVTGTFGILDTATNLFVKLASSGSLSSGNSSAFDFRHEVFFDSGCVPAIQVNSGTVTHLICSIIYGEIVQ